MRQGNKVFCWLVVTLLIFILSPGLSSATTQLDTSFGENGFVVNDFGFGDDEVFDIEVQEDGKIVVVGYSNNGAVKNLAVARFLPDGELDKEFNDDGSYTLSLGSGNTVAKSLALQDDGKIIVAGATEDGGDKIAVLRLTAEGNLDKSFGEDGQLLVPVDDGQVVTGEVQIASDGSIVVAGLVEAEDSTGQSFFTKLTQEGVLDTNFGSDGTALISSSNAIKVKTLTLFDDGKILAGGSISRGDGSEAALLRVNDDGSIDDSYGTNGELILVEEGTDSVVNDIQELGDGSLLAVGFINSGEFSQAFIGKVDEAGKLDADFGVSGIFLSTLSKENVANSVALKTDDSIIVAGFASVDGGKDVFIWEVDDSTTTSKIVVHELSVSDKQSLQALQEASDISEEDVEEEVRQSSQIESTHTTTDIANSDDVGYAITILSDGKVLAAGSSGNGNDKDFAILRYESQGTEAEAAAGEKKNSSGVRTGDYRVITTPAYSITRVSAVSGGIVLWASKPSCETQCKADNVCDDEDAADTCVEDCETECDTIELTGVVYSTSNNPTYTADQTEEETTTTTTTEGDGSTETGGTIFPQGGRLSNYIIKSGQTEDGTGFGVFTSHIEEITPGTQYFVRAYALLTDGTVIYGNVVTIETEDSCFIATAAFGTSFNKHVKMLREFRDRVMLPTKIGRQLVGMYYHYSPPFAEVIAQNEILRGVARIALLPFVWFAFVVLKTTLVAKLCLLLLIGGVVATFTSISRRIQVKST